MRLAPIAYFAFNRPQHTRQTLAALAANPEARDSALHIFVDGPRDPNDQELVSLVAEIALRAEGFASISVHEAPVNKGLHRSIVEGVTSIINEAGQVIVVEDDILVSEFFLSYMNDALARFIDNAEVGSIHGYSPPISGLPQFFFLRGGDCWGWATWADRWGLLNIDANALLDALSSRRLLTEFSSSHGKLSLLRLAQRALGRNQSWAIVWHASLFLANRLTLHPGETFVRNIGNDGSGVHSAGSEDHLSAMRTTYAGIPHIPILNDPVAAHDLASRLDGLAGGGASAIVRRTLLSAYVTLVVHVAMAVRR